jgi:hypothetical protein
MKLKHLLCIVPAAAGLLLTSCEVPDVDTGYATGGTVSTDFVLSYGNGWSGPGYYYGPPGLSYYRHTPGVYYYRSREVVPSNYWGRWHGDRRYYGGPARNWDHDHDGRHGGGRSGGYDRDHDGIPNRYDNRPNYPRRY